MHEDCTQLVTVYGAISPRSCPASYAGVTRLGDKGETLVTVLIPYGVRPFLKTPCTIKIPTENTFVEFRKNERPVITVNYWEPYYADCWEMKAQLNSAYGVMMADEHKKTVKERY